MSTAPNTKTEPLTTKVTWKELLQFATADSYYFANNHGEFGEFVGARNVSKEMLCRIHAHVINNLSDGELMTSIMIRKSAGTPGSPCCRAMIYAAEKRGLGGGE
jgi:hypothetical protein